MKTAERNPAVNYETMEYRLRQAMSKKPDLVCFPECTLTGYLCKEQDFANFSEPVPGPTTERIGRLARENSVHVCFGLLESTTAGTYNTVLLFDRSGNIVLRQRKMSEKPPFLKGDSLAYANTELGRVSILICGDLFHFDVNQLDPSLDLLLSPMSRCFDGISPDPGRWERAERKFYLDQVRSARQDTLLVNALDTRDEEPSFGGAMVVSSMGYVLAESPHGTDRELFWNFDKQDQ